jgi:hypothetical protein
MEDVQKDLSEGIIFVNGGITVSTICGGEKPKCLQEQLSEHTRRLCNYGWVVYDAQILGVDGHYVKIPPFSNFTGYFPEQIKQIGLKVRVQLFYNDAKTHKPCFDEELTLFV